jgi:hypothetical protein
MPQAAVDQLINSVSTNVLGKRELEGSDIVAINNGKELECDIFKRLRRGEWFDAWTIFAGMSMLDKTPFVTYDHSIPLDEARNGRRTRLISRPLRRWRIDIDKWRSQVSSQSNETGIRQVYLRPLFHNGNHFSLLEINELQQMIYHYDSRASENVINGTVPIINGKLEQIRVGKLVEVSVSTIIA